MNEKKPRRQKVKSPFGENLKAIMVKRQLTHKTVAGMAEVSVSVINDWVAGTVPHDLQKVGTLAQRLGVSFSWLLIGQATDARELGVADVFDELPADNISGIYRIIEAKKLIPRKK